MITRRNVLSSLALTAIPATAFAEHNMAVGHNMPSTLEERLAAMSRDELEDYYIERLSSLMQDEMKRGDIFTTKRRANDGVGPRAMLIVQTA